MKSARIAWLGAAVLGVSFACEGAAAPRKLNGTLVAGGDVATGGVFFSPDGSRVLYYADQDVDEVGEIFSVPSGGGTAVQLNATLVGGGDVAPVLGGLRFTPDGSRVIYCADQDIDDVIELYSVPSTGGTQVQLNAALVSGGDVASSLPRISADSSSVFYIADQDTNDVAELYSVPITGGTPVKLNSALGPNGDVLTSAGSPDSSRVVYLANPVSFPFGELFSVPSTGGTVVKLNGTLPTNGSVQNFRYSPDGSRVMYFGDQDVDEVFEMFSVPAAGGTRVQLNGTLVSDGDVNFNGLYTPFSPDGSRIIYFADQDTNDVLELYSVPSAGGTPVKLNGPLVAGGAVVNNAAQFSPDGSRVVYRADQDTNNVNEIYSVPAAGGTPVKLNGPLVSGGSVVAPVQSLDSQISPDGSRVVYLADQDTDNRIEIYSVPIGGGTPVKLSAPLVAGGAVFPEGVLFSPDSTRVIYTADQDTNDVQELYIVPSTGGTPVKLNLPLVSGGDVVSVHSFLGGVPSSRPQFSPDGIRVLFQADADTDEVVELFSRVIRMHWTGPATGNFQHAMNWDQLSGPDEAMQVTIDSAATVTVSALGVYRIVDQLHIGGGSETSTVLLSLTGGAELGAINGVSVTNNGVLAGLGRVEGHVTIAAGGQMSPDSSDVIDLRELTLETGSTLQIDIVDESVGSYSQVTVDDEARLAGLLEVSFAEEGFMPTPGAQFDILQADGGIFGEFDDTSLPELDAGLAWNVVYSNFEVILEVTGLAGDFNGDMVVDAADYVSWRLGVGTIYTPADLDIWKANFGTMSGSGAGANSLPATATVPEPHSLVLLCTAAALLSGARFRRMSQAHRVPSGWCRSSDAKRLRLNKRSHGTRLRP